MDMNAVGTSSPGLLHQTRGAVYVEFLIAFMPLLVAFECLLQLTQLHIASLVTTHAAQCASRAAAVVLPDDPAHYQGVPVGVLEGPRLRDVERAAALPLQAVRGIVSARLRLVDVPDRQKGTALRRELRVEVTYRCGIPLAQRLVCDRARGTAELVATAPLVVHGARYAYD
jgi:hypothetical protein